MSTVKRKKPDQADPSTLLDDTGVDDHDLPGGIPHQVNHPVAPHFPLDPGPVRDYFRGPMSGGVPNVSEQTKPKEDQWETSHKMATVDPRLSKEQQKLPPPTRAVPVYIVSKATGSAPVSRIAAYQILVPATGAVALCARDLKRTHLTICNEDASNAVRIGYDASAAAYGFYIAKASTSPRMESQDVVYASSPSGSAVYVSVLLEYGVTAGAS